MALRGFSLAAGCGLGVDLYACKPYMAEQRDCVLVCARVDDGLLAFIPAASKAKHGCPQGPVASRFLITDSSTPCPSALPSCLSPLFFSFPFLAFVQAPKRRRQRKPTMTENPQGQQARVLGRQVQRMSGIWKKQQQQPQQQQQQQQRQQRQRQRNVNDNIRLSVLFASVTGRGKRGPN